MAIGGKVHKPVAARLVNHGTLNVRALEAYGRFWAAIQRLGEAVEAAEKFALKADDGKRISWSAPTSEDLRLAGKDAARSVEILSSSARQWRTELVSREWR